MFMSSTLQASVFMVKNYSHNCHSIKNTEDLTMTQMFDLSEKLVSEQSDKIYGVKTINWEDSSWKYLSLTGDEQVISLQATKVYVFSDSVLCLGKIHENPQSNTAWEDRLTWFKTSQEYRNLDRIDGEPMEFEWNIFPGFNTLQLSHKVQELLLRLSVTPEKFTGRIILCRCSTTSYGGQKTTRKNASQMLNSFLSLQRDSELDNGHFFGLDQRSGDEVMEVRMVRLVHEQPPGLLTQHTDRFIVENDNMDSYTEAQSEMSLDFRSFLHRWMIKCERGSTNPQKMQQKTATNTLWYGECLSLLHLEASVFMGKSTEDLTMKQMFDISENLISEQSDEIYGVNTTSWEDSSWSIYPWWWRSHQSLAHKGLRIFRFCIVLWKDEREPTIKLCMGRRIDVVQKFTRIQSFGQNWWWANEIRVEDLPWIHHVAAQWRSQRFTVEIRWDTIEFLQEGLSSCRCLTTSHGDQKTMKKNANPMLNSFLSLRSDSEQDNGHFSVMDQRKSGIRSVKTVKVNGTKSLRRWWWHSQKADTQSSEPRVHCPGVSSKAKDTEKLSIHFAADQETIETFSHNYFCKSAQSLRSSRRNVWRMWILSR